MISYNNEKSPSFATVLLIDWLIDTVFDCLVLQLNYCSSVEGYEHHRWRHRDGNHFDISADLRDSSSFGFGLCSRCPPGFGVTRRCTLVQDTVCHSCPPGYYAPSYSRKHACWPCSRCGTVYPSIYLSIYPHSISTIHSSSSSIKRRSTFDYLDSIATSP